MEEAARKRRGHQAIDAGRPHRLAEDRHQSGVAAEGFDIFLHPSQSRDFIEQAPIAGTAGRRFAGEFRMGEEAETAETIIDRDDNGAAARQASPSKIGSAPEPTFESAAVKPDHHRPFGAALGGGRPDVQIEAIFGLFFWTEIADGILRSIGLDAARPEARCVEDSGPGFGRLRRPPAQPPDGRARIGDSLETVDLAIGTERARKAAACDANDRHFCHRFFSPMLTNALRRPSGRGQSCLAQCRIGPWLHISAFAVISGGRG